MTDEVPEEIRENLHTCFQTFQEDGKINKDGLRSILQYLSQEPTEGDLDDMFNKNDKNKDDWLDEEEFNDWMKGRWKSTDEIKKEFACNLRIFCPEDNIDITQFIELLKKYGDDPFTDEEAQEIANEINTDGNDIIEHKELLAYIYGSWDEAGEQQEQEVTTEENENQDHEEDQEEHNEEEQEENRGEVKTEEAQEENGQTEEETTEGQTEETTEEKTEETTEEQTESHTEQEATETEQPENDQEEQTETEQMEGNQEQGETETEQNEEQERTETEENQQKTESETEQSHQLAKEET